MLLYIWLNALYTAGMKFRGGFLRKQYLLTISLLLMSGTQIFGAQTLGEKLLPLDYADSGCLSRRVADETIRQFHIDVRSFPLFNLCDPNTVLYRVLTAIDVMKRLRFSPDIVSKLDRGFLSTNYFDFFLKQVSKIEFKNSSANSIYSALYVNGTMQIFSNTLHLPLVYMMSLLIHEARHADGFFHVKCDHGVKKYTKGCDAHYSGGGAYAVQVEMLMRIATRGLNLSPGFKSAARISALMEIINAFNELPVKPIETLALANRDTGTLDLVKDGKLLATGTSLGPLKKVAYNPTQGYLYTIPKDSKSRPKIIDPYVNQSEEELSRLEIFQSILKFAQDPKLIDFCSMSDESNEFVTLFDDLLKWDGTLQKSFSQTDRLMPITPSGITGPFVLSSEKLYSLKKTFSGKLRLIESNHSWPNDLIKVVSYSGQVIGLNRNGEVVLVNGTHQDKFLVTREHRYSDILRVILYSGL